MTQDVLLFDMDGTLVDSEHQFKLASNSYFQGLIPGWTPEHYSRIVGLGPDDLHAFLVREYGCTRPKAQCFAEWDELAADVYNRRASMTEGLMEFLVELDRAGVRHGLVSSSPRKWIQLFLNRFGLSDEFDPIVSADDVGGRAKPEPEIYLFAARKALVAPDRCMALEDSEHGVRAAKAAGMTCAALRTPFNPEQDLSAADVELRSFRELAALLGL